jgi:hypothetical protein
MKLLELSVVSGKQVTPLQFSVKRMVNGGYVGRNLEAVRAHIEELRREGVSPPSSVPMIFPVLSHNITTADEIEVVGGKTSGEAEFVLLLDGQRIYVGVGSDHTDRDLERYSIVKSKQICHNVLSSRVWRYDEIESYWDDLLIQSWTKATEGEEWVLYQKGPLRTILSAPEIMGLVRSRSKGIQTDGLVIFSGTIPTLTKEMIFGCAFRTELIDSRLGRSLTCEYKVLRLDYLEGVES